MLVSLYIPIPSKTIFDVDIKKLKSIIQRTINEMSKKSLKIKRENFLLKSDDLSC